MLDGDRLWVGVEIGSLQVSNDFGQSFAELPVDPDPQECDIHRILVHPARPDRIIIANGIVGMMSSEDGGKSFQRMKMPAEANYPDAVVIHPDQPDLLFMSAGVGWPVHWYELGRARGKMFRSRDAGKTWERLLGGLPNGQRALFSALTIEARKDGYSLYAADTDGQVFESTRRRRQLDHHRRRAAGVEGRFLQGPGARPREARQRRRHRRQPDGDEALAGGRQGDLKRVRWNASASFIVSVEAVKPALRGSDAACVYVSSLTCRADLLQTGNLIARCSKLPFRSSRGRRLAAIADMRRRIAARVHVFIESPSKYQPIQPVSTGRNCARPHGTLASPISFRISAVCSPSRGAGFGEAIGLPSTMIGVRMPGIVPALA